MKKWIGLMFLFLVASAFSQFDAIIASTENYPDALIAAPVAAKLDVPILLTEKGTLSDGVKETLEELNATSVVIIGGPLVVSEEVETELVDMGLNVTRVWGMLRYGTATEVAEFFWSEGVEKAVLIENPLDYQNKDPDILAQAKELAVEDQVPILLIPVGKIPAEVLSTLNTLGVTNVTIIATNVSTEMVDDLKSINITVSETIQSTDKPQLVRHIRERVWSRIKPKPDLVVIAAANFTHYIATPHIPNATSYIVSSEEEIPELVTFVIENNISYIHVVGKPELAQMVANALENQTNATILVLTGKPTFVNKKLIKEEMGKFKYRPKRFAEWQEKVTQHQNRVRARVEEMLNTTFTNITEMNHIKQQIRELLGKGEVLKAYQFAKQLENKARLMGFDEIKGNKTEFKEMCEKEIKTLRERVQDLVSMNKEFGEAVQQNLTVKERLKLIEEFKFKRKEQVRDIISGVHEGIPVVSKVHEKIEEHKETTPGPGPAMNQTHEHGNGVSEMINQTRGEGEEHVENATENVTQTTNQTMEEVGKHLHGGKGEGE